MFKEFDHRILKIERCVGIEVSLLSEEHIAISGVLLKLEKSKIRKEKEWHFLPSYEELTQKTGTRLPLAVTLNGRGVLIRKLAVQDIPERPVEAVLPNANPNEFYWSVTRLKDGVSVSVVRREILDKIVEHLRQQGFRVLSVTPGIADIEYLSPFLNADIEHIPAATPRTQEKVEYNIGDQYVQSPALLAFGSAMGLLIHGPEQLPAAPQEIIRKDREEYKYERYYKTALRAMLACLFVILLINFLIYSHYFNKNRDREGLLQLGHEQEEKIKKLAGDVHSRESFLINTGWGVPSRLSLFADRIAGLVPSGTLLTGLWVDPVSNGLSGDAKTMSFRRDTIQVAGTCDDPTELNQFTNNLKNIQDFKEVSIRNYAFKKETGSGVFAMEIITK